MPPALGDFLIVRSYYPSDFFFSSRRRHTSSYGDWSSDVCSSDLRVRHEGEGRVLLRRGGLAHRGRPGRARGDRSEERRVGKECSSGVAAIFYGIDKDVTDPWNSF